MGKLNIAATLHQLSIETPTIGEIKAARVAAAVLKHPYYGLNDGRGWLTRFPTSDEWGNELISREWVETFLECGGSFDSQGCWGINPLSKFQPNLSPEKAAEFLRVAHCGRWDNIPYHCHLFPVTVDKSCTLWDYEVLCKGSWIKKELFDLGIEVTNSLHSLGRKNENWVNRKITQNFTFTDSLLEWGESLLRWANELKNVPEQGNKEWDKFRSDWNSAKATKNRKFARSRSSFPSKIVRSVKGVELLKARHSHSINGNLACYTIPQRVRTSAGYVFKVAKHLFSTTHKARVREIGIYSIAKIEDVVFGWKTSCGFEAHIECYTVKAVITALSQKAKQSADKDKALTGILSFRAFRELTSSCLEGTKDFLKDKARFLFELIKEFKDWDQLLASDLAEMELQLTPEFMESIKFRF